MRYLKILCILTLLITLTGCKVRVKIIEKSGDINVQEVKR